MHARKNKWAKYFFRNFEFWVLPNHKNYENKYSVNTEKKQTATTEYLADSSLYWGSLQYGLVGCPKQFPKPKHSWGSFNLYGANLSTL